MVEVVFFLTGRRPQEFVMVEDFTGRRTPELEVVEIFFYLPPTPGAGDGGGFYWPLNPKAGGG